MITSSMPNNKQNKNNKKRQRQLQHQHQKNNTQHQKQQQQQHKLKFVVLLLKIILFGCFTFYVINSFYILFHHHRQQQQHDQVSQQQHQHSKKNDRPLLLSSSKSSLSSNLINKTMTTMTTIVTSASASASASIMETNKNETNTKSVANIYFRYDQVGPQIVEKGIGSNIAPKTHFLSSIPKKYRLLTSDLLSGVVDVVDVVDVDVGSSLGSSNGSSDGSSGLFDKNHHQLLLEDYSSQKKNVWPQKLLLFEMNPSIAKLPNKYLQNPIWHTYFWNRSESATTNNTTTTQRMTMLQQYMPVYVSVYRITHWNNCYDGEINVKMYGGSWKNVLGLGKGKTSSNVSSMIPQTDYLGLALLDSNLTILKDITVTLQTVSTVKFFPNYNDYRLFNLNNEQLYVTSVNHIAPIELSLVTTSFGVEVQDQSQGQGQGQGSEQQQQSQTQSPIPPKGYIQIPNAFQNDVDVDDVTTSTPLVPSVIQLQVFIRKYSSCPIGKTINKRAQASKNLLYFQNTHNNNKQTTNNRNNNDNIQLLFQPRWNPNEVFQNINLNSKCKLHQKDTTLQYSTILDPQEKQAIEPLQTVEKLFYPNYKYEELFVQDRGSACCIDIYVNNTINSDTNNNTKQHEYDDENQQTQNKQQLQKYQLLKVAVVHPKTKYPGNNLPLGITPNTYLSRFIAFLPEDPYTILYKSNMFCLPYPTIRPDDKEGGDNTNDNFNDNNNDNDNGSNLNPLTYMKMVPLEFGMNNETAAYSNCPRIHFVTGMIDKIDTSKDTDNNGEDEEANNDTNANNDFNNNDGSVILSYGVSDCLSRFIEIKKSEIIRMLI